MTVSANSPVDLSALLPALQQLTATIESLLPTLQRQLAGGGTQAQSGAATLGGGGVAQTPAQGLAGGCGCGSAAGAVEGAEKIGQAPPTDDPRQSPVQQAPAQTSGGGGAIEGAAAAPETEAAAPAAPAPSAKGQQLVDAAMSQVGKGDYVWGAQGPDSFDCSGLMVWAAEQAGVEGLPRTSSEQSQHGTEVAKEDLQPGDLVFFGTDQVHHVGMYIGNGEYVHASQPGEKVKVSKLADSNEFHNARRIV